MKRIAGMRRAVALVVAGSVATFASGARAASPSEELDTCTQDYLNASGGSFECSVCGVTAGCDADSCHWGSLKGEVGQQSLQTMIAAGYQLFCLNRGGSLVATASPAGSQGAALDRAFGDKRQLGHALQVGGVLEYTSLNGLGGGDSSSYGAAVPVSFRRSFSAANTDLDLAGTVLFGKSEWVTQYGFSALPSLRWFPAASPGEKQVFGVSVPLQLLVTSGDAFDTSLVYHAGAGGIVGMTFGDLGLGAAADVIYAGGVQIPLQVVGRWGTTIGTAPVAFQLGVSGDAIALDGVLDTLQQNALVGYDTGDWLFGLRVFRQGDDGWAFAAGASNSTRAARLAAGTDDAYQRSAAGRPSPEGAKPARGTDGAARPAETLSVMVVARVGDDPASGSKLVGAIRAFLEQRGLKPIERGVAERAVAPFGGAPQEARELDAARATGHATLAISVRATATPAGSWQVAVLVTGRGIVAERRMFAEADGLEASVRQALAELLATLDLGGLKESAVPPAPRAYPAPPPPSPPPPPPAPPTEAAPDGGASPDAGAGPDAGPPATGGCTKDVECKGDRICINGRCESPK
ncbi:MAG: hypothetical protein HYZ29_10495 [Myxococcales bacterium]|nr:hypothetical protein [Myxococcales bacterium]